MNLEHVQWRWLLVLAVGVVAAAAAVSALSGASLLVVLPPFAGMALIGLAVGWALRHIVRFNPYDY